MTPARTPRPQTATPTLVPIDLSIALPTATAQPLPTMTPMPASPATPGTLTPRLVQVVERYGMDMARRFVVIDLLSQSMTVWDPEAAPRHAHQHGR